MDDDKPGFDYKLLQIGSLLSDGFDLLVEYLQRAASPDELKAPSTVIRSGDTVSKCLPVDDAASLNPLMKPPDSTSKPTPAPAATKVIAESLEETVNVPLSALQSLVQNIVINAARGTSVLESMLLTRLLLSLGQQLPEFDRKGTLGVSYYAACDIVGVFQDKILLQQEQDSRLGVIGIQFGLSTVAATALNTAVHVTCS